MPWFCSLPPPASIVYLPGLDGTAFTLFETQKCQSVGCWKKKIYYTPTKLWGSQRTNAIPATWHNMSAITTAPNIRSSYHSSYKKDQQISIKYIKVPKDLTWRLRSTISCKSGAKFLIWCLNGITESHCLQQCWQIQRLLRTNHAGPLSNKFW